MLMELWVSCGQGRVQVVGSLLSMSCAQLVHWIIHDGMSLIHAFHASRIEARSVVVP